MCLATNQQSDRVQVDDGSSSQANLNVKLLIKLSAPDKSSCSRGARSGSLLLTIIYAWLIMNADVFHTRRAAQSLRILSRLANNNNNRQPSDIVQSLLGRSNRNLGGGGGGGNGMSTIEAIALIQAMNSGNNRGNPLIVGDSTGLATRQSSALSSLRQFVNGGQVTDRQLPVPVPVPVPVPAPFPNAVIIAFVAAFLAAVAAGFPPFIAVVKAIVAALVALIAIIIVAPQANKGNALVKKIVIKKTVLPLIFPITVKKKKEEKEIIYKYKYIPKKEHHHHEYEHDHEHEYYEKKQKKKKYKYKKMDLPEAEDTTTFDSTEPIPMPQIKPIPIPRLAHDSTHLESIEDLVEEQDKLQTALDSVIQTKPEIGNDLVEDTSESRG